MRRNKPPPSEGLGFKNHVFDCQTTSSPAFCLQGPGSPGGTQLLDFTAVFPNYPCLLGCPIKSSYSISQSQVPLCKSLFPKQCERPGLGDVRDAVAQESTKHADCWCLELNSWKTAGKKSHSQQRLAEKKCFMAPEPLSEEKINLHVSVNGSETFGYRFPCIATDTLSSFE